jgi:hypothetical protein
MAVGVYRRCGVGADSLPALTLLTGAPIANLSSGIFSPAPQGRNAWFIGALWPVLWMGRSGRAAVSFDEYRRLLSASCTNPYSTGRRRSELYLKLEGRSPL